MCLGAIQQLRGQEEGDRGSAKSPRLSIQGEGSFQKLFHTNVSLICLKSYCHWKLLSNMEGGGGGAKNGSKLVHAVVEWHLPDYLLGGCQYFLYGNWKNRRRQRHNWNSSYKISILAQWAEFLSKKVFEFLALSASLQEINPLCWLNWSMKGLVGQTNICNIKKYRGSPTSTVSTSTISTSTNNSGKKNRLA